MIRVLVIEDNPDLREFMKLALDGAGYEVSVAADGREGLAQQHQCRAQVVLTDIFMPFKDGIETITELREHYPATRIIAMSGGGDLLKKADYLWAAREFGAVRSLEKPFGADELLEAVRQVSESLD